MRLKYLVSIQLFLLFVDTGCRKLVTVSAPETAVSQTDVYSSDATAIAVLTGIYANISNQSSLFVGSIPSLTLYNGLSSDELTLWSGVTSIGAQAYYMNALSAISQGNGNGYEFWTSIYPLVFDCNAAIEGLNASTDLTPAVKQQLQGEATFMRAFFYFYLVNLYGEVALPLSSDYKVNEHLARSPVSLVYQQIISDLHKAQQLLSSSYLDASLENSTTDRIRPTSWAATALLARTYLYTGNWTGADSAASALINNSLFSLSDLDTAFLRASLGNNEAIWQLQPVTLVPTNTSDAYIFIIPPTGLGTGGNFGAYLSNNLLTSFEPGDEREVHWIDSISLGGIIYYYPNKYKVNSAAVGTPVTEHLMLLRLGEQYLIRAEARANEGNISGAQADLNMIRSRAGLSGTTASTQGTLLSAILHERQVELFTELGQRWLDIKRTNSIDSVMRVVTPEKGGGIWNSYQQLYPIPFTDILADGNLTQNPGY